MNQAIIIKVSVNVLIFAPHVTMQAYMCCSMALRELYLTFWTSLLFILGWFFYTNRQHPETALPTFRCCDEKVGLYQNRL